MGCKRWRRRRTVPAAPGPLHSGVYTFGSRILGRASPEHPAEELDPPCAQAAESLPRVTFVFHIREPFAGFDWTLNHDKTRLVRAVGCARLGCTCGFTGAVTVARVDPGQSEPHNAASRAPRERPPSS
jgi:hypothetical protein